jgi:predicted esterase
MLAGFNWGCPAVAANVSDFADFSLLDSRGNVLLPGRLYVPPEAASDPTKPRPLMVFLHGGGADGRDNVGQLAALSDQMVTQAKQRGAFLYVPQTSDNWNSTTTTGRVKTMIDRAVAQMNADATKLYVTGYSNGGGGTWDMLSRYPNQFAAAIELSGVSAAPDFVATHLANTPIFALHARDDTTAPVAGSRNVINGILAADHLTVPTYPPLGNTSTFFIYNPSIAIDSAFAPLVHQQGSTVDFFLSDPKLDLIYVESPAGGHTGFLGALNAPQPYEWLFAHSLSVPEPGTPVLGITGLIGIIFMRLPRRSCETLAGQNLRDRI